MHHVKFTMVRTAGIIMLAFVGGAAVLALLISATLLLTVQAKDPEDILPAHETALVIFHPTQLEIERWKPWFPMLDEAKLSVHTAAVAVIRTQSGGNALVTLQHGPDASGERIAPFYVQSSSSAALSLLKNTQGTLSQFRPYTSLVRTKKPETYTYFRSDAIPEPTTLWDAGIRTTVLADDRFALLWEENDEQHIERLHENNRAKPRIQNIPQTASGIFLQFTANDWPGYISNLLRKTAEDHALLESRMLGALRSLTGPGVSWEFDMLPVLHGQSTVAIGKNASGSLLIGIRTEHNDTQALQKIMERIHSSSSDPAGVVEVRTRTFDDRFTMRDIRLVDEQATQQEMEEQWTIRSTVINGNTVITAMSDKGLILANDRDVLDALLEPQEMQKNEQDAPPTMQMTRTALEHSSGKYNTAGLRSWLYSFVGTGSLSSPLLPQGSNVEWQTIDSADRTRIVLQVSE